MIKFKEEHVTFEELMTACHDCRKHKRRSENALRFEINDALNLYELWVGLNSETYEVGPSITFCVEHPVKREVFAASFRDMVVEYLYINRTLKYYESELIYDTYSCRKGKGTGLAVRRCAELIAEASEDYTLRKVVVKGDLQSYFMTIDKGRLYVKLHDFLTEASQSSDDEMEYTLRLKKKLLSNEPQHNCVRTQPLSRWTNLPRHKSLFYCKKGKGLPIGDLTSQLDSNFYLSEFDHWIKESLGVRYYGRYVDDFFFICDSEEEGVRLMGKCREKFATMGVTLHPKKLYIQEVRKGVKFVGAVIKPHRVYVSNRGKGNFYQAMKRHSEWLTAQLARGYKPTEADVKYFVGSVNAYLGYLRQFKTFNIRRKVLQSDMMRDWLEYCEVSGDFSKIVMRPSFKWADSVAYRW